MSGLFPCIPCVPWLCLWQCSRDADESRDRGLELASYQRLISGSNPSVHAARRESEACGFSRFQNGHTARGGITAEKSHSKLISAVIQTLAVFHHFWSGVPAFAGHGLRRGLGRDWRAEGVLSASCSLTSLTGLKQGFELLLLTQHREAGAQGAFQC